MRGSQLQFDYTLNGLWVTLPTEVGTPLEYQTEGKSQRHVCGLRHVKSSASPAYGAANFRVTLIKLHLRAFVSCKNYRTKYPISKARPCTGKAVTKPTRPGLVLAENLLLLAFSF